MSESLLDDALRLLGEGLWPVAIYHPSAVFDAFGKTLSDPGKQPIGTAWAAEQPTEASLREMWSKHPDAQIGLKLGHDGGVIDIEVDDPELGEDSLVVLLGGENVETRGWSSRRGSHHLFAWDDRLARYVVEAGSGILKGKKLPGLPGIEVRIGAVPGRPTQAQSVVPPSLTTEKVGGKVFAHSARQWNGIETIAPLPARFFTALDEAFAEAKASQIAEAPAGRNGHASSGASRSDRARAYLATLPFAVSGQRGHDRIYHAACVLAGDFLLTYGQALPILTDWNASHCKPPESAKQVEHKLSDAMKKAERTGKFLESNEPRVTVGGQTSIPEEEWDSPFLHESAPAPPFPYDVFPEPIIRLIREGAEAVQCPADYFAVAALVLAGASIGMTVNLRVTSTWTEAPNLYAAIVGPPGTKKTPALKILAYVLYRIDQELRDQYERNASLYLEQLEAYELAKRARQPGLVQPTEPVRGQLTMDDATREAIAQVHSENLRGLVLIADELTAWVAAQNAYKGGKGDDKQFWLKVNSGSLVKVNRKGDRDPILIGRPCVSVVGGLTPSMLPAIADGNDDGWLDRILFCYPEPLTAPRRWREFEVSEWALEAWKTAISRLWARPMARDESGREKPHYVGLTEGGREAWAAWYDSHAAEVDRLGASRKSLAGPWSKMEGFCLRIALILSQLEQAFSGQHNWHPWDVDGLAVVNAGRVIDFFKAHFRRARSELSRRSSEASEASEALLHWFVRKGVDSFSESEAFTSHRTHDREAVLEAIRWLVDHNFVARVASPQRAPGKAGRTPSPRYQVNPKFRADPGAFLGNLVISCAEAS